MLMTTATTTAASIIDIKIGKKCERKPEREREGSGSNGEKRKSNSANQQISAVKSHRVCLPVIVCVLLYVCVCLCVGACGQPLWLCGSLGYNVIWSDPRQTASLPSSMGQLHSISQYLRISFTHFQFITIKCNFCFHIAQSRGSQRGSTPCHAIITILLTLALDLILL